MDSRIEIREFVYNKGVKPGDNVMDMLNLQRGGDIPLSSDVGPGMMLPPSSSNRQVPNSSTDSFMGGNIPPSSDNSNKVMRSNQAHNVPPSSSDSIANDVPPSESD